ncbi:MAG: calcium/sodium antiporter [Methanosarcinaceae archaeon]|nr:calcium/sodium antiporter [Methanosarcinaceae archaeon]MDD4497729.1 calcium/sodium antiporter [Methanosarcinaceae archaeon]
MLVFEISLFAVGLFLLVKGADLFVASSSSIAKKLGVSEFIIGLTLVSVGTSVPELAASITASFRQASGLVIGNVIGSNIANIGLIVGTAGVLSAVRTDEVMLKRDGYIMFFSALVFLLFVLDFRISRPEALVFLLLYIAYILFLFTRVHQQKDVVYFSNYLKYFFKFEYLFDIRTKFLKEFKKESTGRDFKKEERDKKENSGKESRQTDKEETSLPDKNGFTQDFLKLIVSGVAIILGARYLVRESIILAELLNLPETIIGASLVAVGTSLPELMVTVTAARSGRGDIALGNAIGSNITNTFLILGCAGLLHPLQVTELSVFFVTPFMIFISLLFLFFIWTGWKIKRLEGLFLILVYSGFMFWLFSTI